MRMQRDLKRDLAKEPGHVKWSMVIDLARELPRNSDLYYDYLHYTESGAATVAGILDRHLEPWLARRFPSFRTR